MKLNSIDPLSAHRGLQDSILRSAIRIVAIGAPLVSIVIVVNSYFEDHLNLRTVLLGIFTLLFPLLWAIQDWLSQSRRASIFLGLMLLMSFFIQARGGLTFSHAALVLWILLLAGLIFGLRGVLLALSISLATLGIAGYLLVSGIAPPIEAWMWSHENPEYWIRAAIVLALFGGTSASAVVYIVQRLDIETQSLRASLDREKQQRIELEKTKLEKENAIRALADAQRVEALGRLASGVAHDFNNSLTIITGSAEIAQLEPDLPDRVASSLNAIKRASLHAADMTRSLLAFGRKDPTKLEHVEVGELLNSMAESLGRLLPEDIQFRISDVTQAVVQIDRAELERALLNLVINAKDSIERQGEIVVGCRSIEVTEDSMNKPGTYVEIWVKDNGRGMTDEVKAKVFEPFYTTKPVGKGTGMGMAILHGVIKEAKGDIKIESSVGAGTTVSLYIPQVDKPITRDSTKSTAIDFHGTAGRSVSILIVEDNPEVLTVTAKTIENAGYTVSQATDGDSALKLIEESETQFDLLCIDGVIPGTSSAKVIEFVQRNYPDTRIIVCSGYIEEELLLRGIRTGELAYVKKPYLSSELLGCIRDELGLTDSPSRH